MKEKSLEKEKGSHDLKHSTLSVKHGGSNATSPRGPMSAVLLMI